MEKVNEYLNDINKEKINHLAEEYFNGDKSFIYRKIINDGLDLDLTKDGELQNIFWLSYRDSIQPALHKLKTKDALLEKEYQSKIEPAKKEFEKIQEKFWAEYQKKLAPFVDEYNKTYLPVREKYDSQLETIKQNEEIPLLNS